MKTQEVVFFKCPDLQSHLEFTTFTYTIIDFVYTQKFSIAISFNFSWDDCNTHEKIGNNSYAKFSGSKEGALWSMRKW